MCEQTMFKFVVVAVAVLATSVTCRDVQEFGVHARARGAAITAAAADASFQQMKADVVVIIKQEDGSEYSNKLYSTSMTPEMSSLVDALQHQGLVDILAGPILIATVFAPDLLVYQQLVNEFGYNAQYVSSGSEGEKNVLLYNVYGGILDLVKEVASGEVYPTLLAKDLVISLQDETVSFIGEDSNMDVVAPEILCKAKIHIIDPNFVDTTVEPKSALPNAQ